MLGGEKLSHVSRGGAISWFKGETITMFAYAEIWLMLVLMVKCCERKTLFRD